MNENRAYKISLVMSIIAIVAISVALLGLHFGRWSQKRDFVAGNQNYLAQQWNISGDFQRIGGELLIGPYSDLWRHRYTFFGNPTHFSFWLYNFTLDDGKRWMQELGSKQVPIQGIIESRQYAQDGSQFAGLQDIFRDNLSVHIIGDDRLGVSYQHAKTFFTDNQFIIQTANMTYSSFHNNREIFFISADTGVLSSIQSLFRNDWAGLSTSADALHPNLVVCPINCRHRVESLLESAQSSIYMYQQYIQDPTIQTILMQKKKTGIDIKIILGNDPTAKTASLEAGEEPDYRTADAGNVWDINRYIYDASKARRTLPSDDENNQFLHLLSGSIFVQTSPYVHAKAILIDDQFLLVGSMNISPNSLDNNREIGILLLDSDQLSKFKNMFLKDWNRLVLKSINK